MTLTFDTLAPKVNGERDCRENLSNDGRLTLTGFPILVQLESRRAPAVEASNGVTAESLTPSVCLLAFIHIWQERRVNLLK